MSQTEEYQKLIFDHLTLYPDEYFTFGKIREEVDDKLGILTKTKRKNLFNAFDTMDEFFENIDKDYIYADGLQTAISFVTNQPEQKKKVSLRYLPTVNLSEVPNYINKVLEDSEEYFDPFYPNYEKKRSVFDYLVDSAKIKYNVNEDRIPKVFDRMIKNNYHEVSRNAEKNIKKLVKMKEQLSKIETDVSLELEDMVDKLTKKLSSEYINNILYENERLIEKLQVIEFNNKLTFWLSHFGWIVIIALYFYCK